MKRTAITYRAINGKIYVKKIDNAAGVRELDQRFGKEVALEYLQGAPMYMKNEDGKHEDPNAVMVVLNGEQPCGQQFCIMGKGDVMGSKEFGEIIEAMKAAGARLGKLCEHSAERTVVI